MINLTNLTKTYVNSAVLEEVSISFPSKGLICLTGESGSGKSTLLNMLAGFDTDYKGKITVKGTSLREMSTDELCAYRRNHVGFVFQDYHLLKGYTVLENVLISCKSKGIGEDKSIESAKNLISTFGLSNKVHEKIENLSGGQKQRVAIARALIHEPDIILADEPTGALDRTNATEIMGLLKEIAKERLVIVITHDPQVCTFADEVMYIQDKKLMRDENNERLEEVPSEKFSVESNVKTAGFRLGYKNFKVNSRRYLAVSLAISIGIFAFMLSLSFGNSMDNAISSFKDKNTAFTNGYIEGKDDKKVLDRLNSDKRLDNVHYQYKLSDVSLQVGHQVVKMSEKYPLAKATEKMSYGTMPKREEKEIALSPSLSKKFSNDISTLLGENLILTFEDEEYPFTVSGIFNAGYDDFFVSSDSEQQFYKKAVIGENYSISYDVKEFKDIVPVSKMLENEKIVSQTAAEEAEALHHTFTKLSRLFITISVIIMAVALFIGTVLLVKLQNSRYKEFGLMSALGFSRSSLRKMIRSELFFLLAASAIFQLIFMGSVYITSSFFDWTLIVSTTQVFLSILATVISVSIISTATSFKLVHTEPAVALRK